ncbi:MAG: hypothetical protein FJ034_03830, partial [Chloroflexi bacterium]|nr:hypothetical protein [Chloroflexota bacterium]
MLLEECPVVSTRPVGALGTVLLVRAPGIAAQARPGQLALVRAAAGFDPVLRRAHPFLRIDREGGEVELLLGAAG